MQIQIVSYNNNTDETNYKPKSCQHLVLLMLFSPPMFVLVYKQFTHQIQQLSILQQAN